MGGEGYRYVCVAGAGGVTGETGRRLGRGVERQCSLAMFMLCVGLCCEFLTIREFRYEVWV